MYVACSTLCFARYPLDQALRVIGELDFSKVDVAIHEKGPHLKPSEVAEDVTGASQRIRIGPRLARLLSASRSKLREKSSFANSARSVAWPVYPTSPRLRCRQWHLPALPLTRR